VKNNPDTATLLPTLAVGFADLRRRIDSQRAAAAHYATQLKELHAACADARQTHGLTSSQVVPQLRRRNVELSHRLMRCVRSVECLRAQGILLQPDEVNLYRQLQSVRRELAKPAQFRARITELASLVRIPQDRSAGGVGNALVVDDENLLRLQQALRLQKTELYHLTNVVKKDMKDLDILADGLRDVNSKMDRELRR
jgi:nuclear pore complex protein Nup54